MAASVQSTPTVDCGILQSQYCFEEVGVSETVSGRKEERRREGGTSGGGLSRVMPGLVDDWVVPRVSIAALTALCQILASADG